GADVIAGDAVIGGASSFVLASLWSRTGLRLARQRPGQCQRTQRKGDEMLHGALLESCATQRRMAAQGSSPGAAVIVPSTNTLGKCARRHGRARFLLCGHQPMA